MKNADNKKDFGLGVKAISFVLSFLMIVTVIPSINVFAEEKDAISSNSAIDIDTKKETEKEPEFVCELSEKRTLNEKYFLMDDGSITVAQYNQPVHFADADGSMKDIDNSLVEVTDTATDKKLYRNKSNSFNVSFSAEISDDELAFMEKEENKIAWSLEQNNITTAKKIETEKTVDKKADEIENITSSIEYDNVFDSTDITYVTNANGVKENIVLKDENAPQQFSFKYNTFGLKHRITDESDIEIYNEEDAQSVVFYIEKPYMYDAEKNRSDDVKMEVIDMEDGFEITMIPDPEWVNSPERVYPIVIDPTTLSSQLASGIWDIDMRNDQTSSFSHTAEDLLVGVNSQNKIFRSVIRFVNLPNLGDCNTIVNAKMNITAYQGPTRSDAPALRPRPSGNPIVHINRVTQDWCQPTNWNAIANSYDPTVTDYLVYSQTDNSFQTDITKLVRGWYDGTYQNYGIMLKSADESTPNKLMQFTSSDYGTNGSNAATWRPVLLINYRNSTGLEDYWSYTTQNMGGYGTGYVNNYNGNLIYVHNDVGCISLINGFTLSHVYNTVNAYSDTGRFGKGWGLNLSQEFKPFTIESNSAVKYVYTDGDGTKHFFVQTDGGDIVDEDGLGYKYSQISEGQLIYKLNDKDGNVLKFDLWGALRAIVDNNGNSISINYSPVPNQFNYLTSISTSSGKTIQLFYDSEYKLTSIVDNANRTTTFSYTNGNLTKIIYPDGTDLNFEYYSGANGVTGSSSWLHGIIVPSGYQYRYGNYNNGKIYSSWEENTSGIATNLLYYAYDHQQTVVNDIYNRNITYQFDSFGRMTCAYDAEGNSYYESYTENGNGSFANNKLNSISNNVKYVDNIITNPVFSNGLTSWVIYEEAPSVTQISTVSNQSYISSQSVNIESTASSIQAILQYPDNVAGKTYTLQANIKTDNVVSVTHGAGVEIVTNSSSGNKYYYSNFILGTTDSQINNGFVNASVTAEMASDESIIRISVGLYNASGTVWIDSVQLEEADTANKINLISNSNFERNNGWHSTPQDFNVNYADASSGAIIKADGTWGFSICGNTNQNRYINQTLSQSGKAGDVYSFGSWVKSSSVPYSGNKGSELKMVCEFTYCDNTTSRETINYNSFIYTWQYSMKNICAKKDYSEIKIYLCYNYNCNVAYFDCVFLYRDTVQSYKYDSNGNVISTSDNANQLCNYQYNNNSLSKILNPAGTCYEYGYDNDKNLVFSKNSEGLQSNISYDEYGNPTGTITLNKVNSSSIQNGKRYNIRLKGSGKYLTVENSGTANTTNVLQSVFTGFPNQIWTTKQTADGYFVLIPENAPGSCLHIENALNNQGQNIDIWENLETDSQKCKIIPQSDYSYKISPKRCDDGKLITVSYSSSQDNVTIVTEQPGNNANQEWYFEEVIDNSTVQFQDGAIYMFMARNSGKYFSVENNNTSAGSSIIQFTQHHGNNQKYRVNRYGQTDYYTLAPISAPNSLIQVGTELEQNGYNYLQLGDSNINDRKLFKFEYNSQYNGYYIIPKYNESLACDVANFRVDDGALLIFTGKNPAINRFFIPEKLSDTITSSATYQDNGNYLHTVTDSRGKTTTYTYDTLRGLNTGITDANGNTTSYSYNSLNDRLQSVSSNNKTVSYTYNTSGKLHTITSPDNTQYSFTYDSFGNSKEIYVGNRKLIENFYESNNYNLSYSIYGNGNKVGYTYDMLDRVTEKLYNDVVMVVFKYDKFGNLYSKSDLFTNVHYKYDYDLSGRILGITATDGTSVNYIYDNFNRVTKRISKIPNNLISTEYIYGSSENGQLNGVLYSIKQNGQNSISYTYDELARTSKRTIDAANSYETEYSYSEGASANTTTTMIKSVKNGNDIITYTYDDVGNITEIKKNGNTVEEYEYDGLNQLTKVTRGTDVYIYSYDNGGNITEVKLNGNTVKSYTYGDTSWKDLLTSFNNQTITYDNIGNPLSYRDGFGFTWSNGRQLTGVTHGTDSISYQYDDGGLRTQKTVNDTTTDYYWLNGILQGQKKGNEYIIFMYDENGSAYGFLLKNGTTEDLYYYLFNAQGDVIGIVDESGTQVVSYEYSAWGEVLSVTGTSANTIGQINPIRYRGYYYDNETNIYYLQSRYYDPETGRFINADGYVSTGQGILGNNMFAYCLNDPIRFADDSGTRCVEDRPNGRWVMVTNSGNVVSGGAKNASQVIATKATKKTQKTKMSPQGVKFIADYEGGFHSTPYDDGYGNLTIGYGHLIKNNEIFVSITEDQALQMLSNDLARFEEKVTVYSDSLGIVWDQNQYDAFVDLAYNSGNGFKKVMDNIVAGDDPYSSFAQIIYANGKKSLGLYRRRMDEADMFCMGVYRRTYRGW